METKIGLQVCIGKMNLSLQELADMQKGELLQVVWTPGQVVTVLLGEERIAEARLVTDGEAVFAEIVKVFS